MGNTTKSWIQALNDGATKNHYEIKQEERRERYQELAEKNRQASIKRYNTSKQLGDMIPFGQPILIGHHSEARHRKHIEKINNNMRKAIEHDEKANYFQNRANNMSSSISSDDPDAIKKLKEKLSTLEKIQLRMKEENAKARKEKTEQPFEKYQLSNNNANIRTVKQRIAHLEARDKMEVQDDIVGNGWTLHENKDANRIQFLFDGVPSEEVRKELKSRGFRWSPSNKAWQAFLTNRGRYQAKQIITKLQ